jgi:hypothetical protein
VLRNFFALKNLTASARFEPANLGTKGQHATSRPPKPPDSYVTPILTRVRHAHKIWKQQLCKIQDLDLNGQTVLNWTLRKAMVDSELKSNRFRWRALVKKELDIRVPRNVGNCFSNCETISVSSLFCSMELAAWKVRVEEENLNI